MEERLIELYQECLKELKSIKINIEHAGKVNICLSKKKCKRYGCCKQENPDTKFYHYKKRGKRKIKIYDRFKSHRIEISKWVMDLDEKIIKNTIMHEIIHCFPNCNNHGKVFKQYANYINEKLGYNIERLGNKKEDYLKSNIIYKQEDIKYYYKIKCIECGLIYYRQRLRKNLLKAYRCGRCNGRLEIIET